VNTIQEICYDCEETLTADNTRDHGGIDEFNHRMAIKLSPSIADTFIKCDDCFDKDIDIYLQNQEF
jgi:hypothetical protein